MNALGNFEQIPPFPDMPSEHEVDHLQRVTEPAMRRRSLRSLLISTALVATPPVMAGVSISQNEWLFSDDTAGAMIGNVPNCPEFTQITERSEDGSIQFNNQAGGTYSDELKLATLLTEIEHTNTVSAAENFDAKKFELSTVITQWAEVLRHKQLTFTSEISGLHFAIYSDRSDAFDSIDTSSIDKLTHAILDPAIHYPHVGMQEFADCMRWRFVDPQGPRELEGVTIHLYIVSDRGVCFKNGIIQDKPKQNATEFCDSVGATKAGIVFAFPPFLNEKADWSVIMATAEEKESAERQISRRLLHELSGHYLLQRAGQEFAWDLNESAAQEYEEQAIRQLYPDNELPQIVSYRD
jgi:hypothetical protein